MNQKKSKFSQSFNHLLKATTAEAILTHTAECHWYQEENEGEPPKPTPADLLTVDKFEIENENDNIITPVWDELSKQVWDGLSKQQQALIGSGIHSKTEIEEEKQRLIDYRRYYSCIRGLTDGFLKLWHSTLELSYSRFDGNANISEPIQQIHQAWQLAIESDPELMHPLAPLVRAWLTEQTAKRIDGEYDRKHPVAIVDKSHMGSIRDVIVYSDKEYPIGEIRTSAPPPQTSQIEIPALDTQSTLPAVLPFQAVKIVSGIETQKNGVYPMPIRLFWEANFALSQGVTQETIRFALGDLLQFLNPNGKYNRHEHLPYVLNALHSLFFLRIPYRDNPDNPKTEVDWIPVLPRTVPNVNSGDDASIILEVKLPPDTRQGMMIEKEKIRQLGKYSAAKTNAYLTACWIFDQYGTMRKGIIDPTRPLEQRDAEGFLLDENGNRIVTPRGKPIRNLFAPEAIRQLPRVDNKSRKAYPILNFADLTRACYPKGYPQGENAKYQKRALKAWQDLEKEGVVVIERLQSGWRIMPSASHIGHYRALMEAKKQRR